MCLSLGQSPTLPLAKHFPVQRELRRFQPSLALTLPPTCKRKGNPRPSSEGSLCVALETTFLFSRFIRVHTCTSASVMLYICRERVIDSVLRRHPAPRRRGAAATRFPRAFPFVLRSGEGYFNATVDIYIYTILEFLPMPNAFSIFFTFMHEMRSKIKSLRV